MKPDQAHIFSFEDTADLNQRSQVTGHGQSQPDSVRGGFKRFGMFRKQPAAAHQRFTGCDTWEYEHTKRQAIHLLKAKILSSGDQTTTKNLN